jgi:hypothetical protein
LNTRTTIVSALFIALALPLLINAQSKVLSSEGRKLTDALDKLQKEPNDPVVQEQYLRAFPHDYKGFLGLFDLGRELYDGHEFIVVLSSLAKNHETEVGRLVVQLGKEAHWDADAPNYLSHETTVYGGQHTKTFATLLRQLPTSERDNLVTFLAHAENLSAYPEFQELIDDLKNLGQNDLAKEFEAARTVRERANSR